MKGVEILAPVFREVLSQLFVIVLFEGSSVNTIPNKPVKRTRIFYKWGFRNPSSSPWKNLPK